MANQQNEDRFKDIPALANPTTPSMKRLRARLEGRPEPPKPRQKKAPEAPPKATFEKPTTDAAAADSPAPESKPFKPKLTKPHELIAQAREKPPEPDRYGFTRYDRRPKLDMTVSRAQERHAFIVLDRLFKVLEADGLEVAVLDRHDAQGTFALNNHSDKAKIRIDEKYKQVPHTPTKQELADKERYRTRIPKYDRVPTGQLTLHPGGVVDFSSEEALNALIAKAVDELKAEIGKARVEREEATARRREEAKREREAQEEKQRIQNFREAAEALDQYHKQMAYIEEVRRFGRPPDDQRRAGQTLEQWLRWAEERARRIHPLG